MVTFDNYDIKDVGQALLSLFAIFGVFYTKTILPVDGILLTFVVLLVLFVAFILLLIKRSLKKAVRESVKHLINGFVISFILTLILGIAYGFDVLSFDVWLSTELIVAFNVGLLWSSLIDTLLK